MTFRVGQKVVCVNAICSSDWSRAWLVEGEVYTVSGHVNNDRLRYLGAVPSPYGVTLLEIRGKHTGFGSMRFRPIVERKTDISIFTKMLIDSKIGISA